MRIGECSKRRSAAAFWQEFVHVPRGYERLDSWRLMRDSRFTSSLLHWKQFLCKGRPFTSCGNHAFIAYFRRGKYVSLFAFFAVADLAWEGARFLRMARVFFDLRSRGRYFLPSYASRRLVSWFWRMTVSTCAIDNLTTLILDNLFGAPPVTLATRRAASSVLSSLSCRREAKKRSCWFRNRKPKRLLDNRAARRRECRSTF